MLLPLSAAEVLNSSAPPKMSVPAASKAAPLENPPEASAIPAEDSGSSETTIQASSEQPNGVATTEESTKQVEEPGQAAAPVSHQEAAADPAGNSADLPVSEESVPSTETPTASSEEPQADKEVAPTQESQSQEAVVAAKESTSQEVVQNTVEQTAPEEPKPEEPKPVAEKILDDPKPSASEDVPVNSEVGKATESPKAAVPAQDEVVASTANKPIESEIPKKEEPLNVQSKAVQAKGTSKCQGPSLSFRQSGWSILWEGNWAHTHLFFWS